MLCVIGDDMKFILEFHYEHTYVTIMVEVILLRKKLISQLYHNQLDYFKSWCDLILCSVCCDLCLDSEYKTHIELRCLN
jgi:hypothetical protein